jgi:hypothetical protein
MASIVLCARLCSKHPTPGSRRRGQAVSNCAFASSRVAALAVTSELGRHAEHAVERPEPALMLRPAPLLIDPVRYQISAGRSICRRWGSHENVTARALPRAWVVASKFAAGILLCNDSGDIS